MRKDFKATLPRDISEAVLESSLGNPDLSLRNLRAPRLSIKTAFIDTIEEMSMHGLSPVDSPVSNLQDIHKRRSEIASEDIEMLKCRKSYSDFEGASIICFETISTRSFRDGNSFSKTKTVAFESFLVSRGTLEFLPHSQESGDIKQLLAQIYESGIGLSKRLFTTAGCYLGIANNDIRKVMEYTSSMGHLYFSHCVVQLLSMADLPSTTSY